MELERRENIPNIQMVADHVIKDQRPAMGLRVDREPDEPIVGNVEASYASLDAIGTMEDLTVDDLMALAIELARRIVALEVAYGADGLKIDDLGGA
jgi:hypothetical protein